MSNATPNPAKVYRLHDMVVEEVSLVDRAANRRKFLIVKRDGENTMGVGAEVTQRADGSFVAAGTQQQAAPAAGAPAVTPPAAPVAKASIALTADAQTMFTDVLEEAIDNLTASLDMVKAAKVIETQEEADADALLEMVMASAEDLSDTVSAYAGIEEAPAEGEGEGEEGAAPGPMTANAGGAPPPNAGAPVLPMGKRLDVRRAKRTIAKSEGERVGMTLLQKYGAKMSKERRSRFEAAMKVLSEVFGEVQPMLRDKAAGKKPKPGEKMPPAPPAAPAKKADDPEAAKLKTANEKLTKQLGDIQTVAKRQAEQLAAARSSRAPSNAVGVEPTNVKKSSDHVSWPVDMNDDRYNRETAGKDFFG